MKIGRLLFCFISAALCGVIVAQSTAGESYKEGEDFRGVFQLPVPEGSRKYLCRNRCKDESDVLIATYGKKVRGDRLTLRYEADNKSLHVDIRQLRVADAGRYEVGVGNLPRPVYYREFEIKVRELCVFHGQPSVYSVSEGGSVTVPCPLHSQAVNRRFLCRGECRSYLVNTDGWTATSGRYGISEGSGGSFDVTIRRLTGSDGGRYRCGLEMSEQRCHEFEIRFPDVAERSVLVIVVITIVVAGVFVAICAIIIYRWKRGDDYVNTRRNTRNTENPQMYVNNDSAEGSTYEDLDPNRRERSVYWSLRK